MNKKYLYGFIFLGILFITLVSGILIDTFSNGLTSSNITFSSDENISLNLTIPKNAEILSSIINLSASKYTCYQESANTSNQTGIDGNCELNYSGTYDFNNNLNDGNWNTYSTNDNFYITYSKPRCSPYNVTWNIKDISGNHSLIIPENISLLNEINFRVQSAWEFGSNTYRVVWSYINSTGSYITLLNTNKVGNSSYWYAYEEAIVWNCPAPSSPYIQINNTQIWNHTGEFNSTFSPNKTDDFASILNSALNGGNCDCTGCYLSGNYCNISTIFHSDTAGKIQYDTLEISYTPAPFVTLESPSNNTYAPSTKTFNCSATDEEGLSNITFYFYNSTGQLNLSKTIDLSNTYNSTTYDMVFNSTDTWTWGCSAFNNNSRSWWADANFTINVDIDSPIINSLSPANNSWRNLDSNVTFYYTPSHSTDTIDTCKLYANFTGNWSINQTDTSINTSNQNNFTLNLSGLPDADYEWTIWCNTTTLGNSAYSQSGNYTLKADSTYPKISIDTITTTAGSQTFSFTNTVSDTNIDSCKYSIFNSTGQINGLNENISFTCGLTTNPTVTAYGTYNLTIYAIDYALNENSSTLSFTTSASAGVTITGGGGGGGSTPQIDVIAIILPEGTLGEITDLQRAIIYARILEFEEDGFTLEEKNQILENLRYENIAITLEELTIFINQISDEKIENIKVSEIIAKKYDLVKTVLVFEFVVVPRVMSGDTSFVCSVVGGEVKQFQRPIKANKLFESCEVTGGNWQCQISNDSTTAYITYEIKEPDFFIQTLEGEVKYISKEGEVDYTRVISLNLVNYCSEIGNTGIRVIYVVILGVSMLIGLIWYISKKRKTFKLGLFKKNTIKRLLKLKK